MKPQSEGKLEYHIPQQFDDTRPPFTYSHINYDVAIGEHPLACRVPSGFAGEEPATVLDPYELFPLMRREDAPTKIEDYLYSDKPQLSLHVVSFTDATLVSLTWPHTLWDAMGRREFLLAWTAILAGRDDEVLPLHGFDTDPLGDFCESPQEESKLIDKSLSILQLIVFGIRYWFEHFWYTEEETRIVCIPSAFMKRARETAISELKAARAESGKSTDDVFLSDGDIISAWGARLLAEHLQVGKNQTVCVLNAFGWRSLLSPDILPRSKAYVANASSGIFAFLKGGDILSRPLSYTASEVRRAIAEQGTRSQLEASVKLTRESIRARGVPPMYGDATMQLIIVSNWSKGRFFEMDFSPAIVPGSKSARPGDATGKPTYIQAAGHANGFSIRNAFQISGKDGEGNYWLSASLRKHVWSSIEKALTGTKSTD